MESEEALVAKGRMNSYTWMANFYLAEPGLETLRGLLSEDVLSALEGLFEKEGADSIRRLREFARHLDEAAAIRARREYQRLFNLSVKTGYVPPYESCIRERRGPASTEYGTFWGAATNDVFDFYKSVGFNPNPSEDILAPDHLGLELVFMSVLCGKEGEALEKGNHEEASTWRDLELRFLNEHLTKWVGGYVADLKAKTGGIFSSIATLTQIFVKGDAQMLSSELEKGKG